MAFSFYLDQPEYSRFEPERSVITAQVEVPNGFGATAVAQLVKARRARDVVVAETEFPVSNGKTTIVFDLNEIVDATEVPKVKAGKYLIRVSDKTAPSTKADSPDIRVAIVTAAEMRALWLFGLAGASYEVLTVKDQPEAVSGVSVVGVSPGHPIGWEPLSFEVDGTNKVLTWGFGNKVVLTAKKKKYTLRLSADTAHYVDVFVPDLSALPSGPASEELYVGRMPAPDSMIQRYVDAAVSWVEDEQLAVRLEPTRIVTDFPTQAVQGKTGSTVPVFVGVDHDELVNALTYTAPTPGHWINFKMPYLPIIRIDELAGKIANQQLVQFDTAWIAHHKFGMVEILPYMLDSAFRFLGLLFLQSLRGPVPLPNFWRFNALIGYAKTPLVLVELVQRKAAIDVLTQWGQAYRGGMASMGVSREGVSENVTYTGQGEGGVFGSYIAKHEKFIAENLRRLRGATRGVNMAVL